MREFGFVDAARFLGGFRRNLPARARGYVAAIDECALAPTNILPVWRPPLFSFKICVCHFKAENTETGYRFWISSRAPFRIKVPGSPAADVSWIFAMLRAYNSNALIFSSASIHLGYRKRTRLPGLLAHSVGCLANPFRLYSISLIGLFDGVVLAVSLNGRFPPRARAFAPD